MVSNLAHIDKKIKSVHEFIQDVAVDELKLELSLNSVG
jgi:hypothetical protein